MKFKAGDRVFLFNSNEHGTVEKIIDKDELIIKIGKSEIIVFAEMLRPFEANEQVVIVDDAWYNDVFDENIFSTYAPEILLCFVPIVNKIGDVEKFKFIVVNTLPFRIKTSAYLQIRQAHFGNKEMLINPGKFMEAGTMLFTDLNDTPIFDISAETHDGKLFDIKLKLRAKSFFNKSTFNPILGTNTYTYTLFNWDKKKEENENKSEIIYDDVIVAETKSYYNKHAYSLTPKYEVDLHIEKLVDDYMLLNPGEALDIQMRAFDKELDAAIHRRQKNIVFIHGLGKGVLKKEIIKILDKHPFISNHRNADFNKYGFGALEVIFKI